MRQPPTRSYADANQLRSNEYGLVLIFTDYEQTYPHIVQCHLHPNNHPFAPQLP